MLETLDLSLRLGKKAYRAAREQLEPRLILLQRQILQRRIPVLIVFEGWAAAGKGTLINELMQALDPRGFKVHSILPPTPEESLRPFLWRFWVRTPARGRIAIFDRSWYRPVIAARVDGSVRQRDLQRAVSDIQSFERQLADDGTVILKFFLHISKREQKRRFDKLRRHKETAWRVTPEDLERHKQYGAYGDAVEEILAATDSPFAPWTLLPATDRRFAAVEMSRAVVAALRRRVAAEARRAHRAAPRRAVRTGKVAASVLARVDLSKTLGRSAYRGRLGKKQKRLRVFEHEIYMRRIPVVIVYEGWDAAGKGGNIRRLTQELDPRGYEVVPITAPNDLELAHHYLWRFWTQMPKAGHMTIFDRSWYGRVLVERVEGLCSEIAWQRAYREINELEEHLANFGTVLVKFWLHIDAAEQLRRYRARSRVAHKRWKITQEDWRNRAKWDAYRVAVEEMLTRTSTAFAPWTVVESNCKRWARVKTLDTVIEAIERRL